MVEARELTNAELAELTGAGLTGEDRVRLVARGLVEQRQVGRSYAFELSAHGWSEGLTVLAEQAHGKGAAATTVRMLLHGLNRVLAARGVDARSFFGADAGDPEGAGVAGTGAAPPGGVADGDARAGPTVASVDEIEDRIRTAYAKVAPEPAGWVSLADLRGLLEDIPRSELDTALKWMAVQPGVRLIPIANQKSLSTREQEAALRFGGENNHALAIEGS
jgi:hypothetical protein